MLKSVLTTLSTCLMLIGCAEPPVETTGPGARPVKSIVVDAPTGAGVRNFPGRVESTNRADLAFRLGGTVERLHVVEGTTVRRGQALAELDKTDLEITLRDRQATWDQRSRDYERGKELVTEGAISRRDFDQVEANFRTADAALDQARQNLGYAVIRAPFAGQVAERHVDAFEEVTPGQVVYSVIDRDTLEVQIDVPENIVQLLPTTTPSEAQSASVPVRAVFEGSNQSFPLTFKEAASRADAKTQTFQVTFNMRSPDGVTVLPGMTASVSLDLSSIIDESAVFHLPISALVGDEALAPRVWTIDETTMTVHPRDVVLGRMIGSSIEVLEGVEPGLRVVTAGAAYLDEGMEVILMEEREQAEPRTQDRANS